ncbi:hypothetical protein SERLA73DRAFT_65794 [Serpula lacrymans var. lacrymans S7.3]|uniref:TFIID subunit TAF5 NTD2 domain-containing protein n=1 Tax=Serpula lacrymans var. lacrymans (strain S7.3) TaxID=936435 RepID=F8QGU5_SERL3|nr:hypothetical protein SERLA73DRAFT_65794 [Serpula lacrymans var. lacrymans S7.3]
MSSTSPAVIRSSGVVSPPNTQDASQNITTTDRLVLDYLRSRGHKPAEKAFLESLGSVPSDDNAGQSENLLSSENLIKNLAIHVQKPSRPGENLLKEGSNVLKELTAMGNPPTVQNLIANIGPVGAEEILSLDPTDKKEGFRELESWVDGSLDMYRPEFRPILFPIFCHFYLDLVQHGFREAASSFYYTFSPSLLPMHHITLRHLSTLLLPSHVQNDEVAQHFRNEKYVVKMTRSGFSLLVGWLIEGVGGEAPGHGDGFTGERSKRGRAAVMRVVNNHLRFDVTSTTTMVSNSAWEESTGLLSSFVPQTSGSVSSPSPQAFNALKGELKLGPAPIPEELRTETERVLREQAMVERDPGAQYDLHYSRPAAVQGLVAPTESDLLPHPTSFKAIDIQREVEKVRDARKRIRLDPSVLNSTDLNMVQNSAAVRARGLPSICAYTLHDVGEGAPICAFSPDVTLMAAGFSESYIRLWSLKGENLQALPGNDLPDSIRGEAGTTSRKLVGHSGAVYALSFDPLSGSAAPPRYLLSGSADSTVRLWSLDTFTNVVAYRGHQNPVWDVQWSPIGIYFATASRDKTARLWSTDRASCLRIYAGHLSDVDCIRFHPNSLYLATGSSDWTARLWDVQGGSCVRVFIGHQGPVSTLAISPDGRYLASAGVDLSISLWDLGSGRRIKKMTGHTSAIYSLSFSAESSVLVSGGADWTVRCWDVKAAGCSEAPRENAEPEVPSKSLACSSDLMATFSTKQTPITNVHFTPRNLCLVAGNYVPVDYR